MPGLGNARVPETGADAVGLDWGVDGAWAAREVQTQARCRATSIRCSWWPAAMRMDAGVDAVLAQFAGGPHIFNLGHGIVPETPPEHVARLVKRVRGSLSPDGVRLDQGAARRSPSSRGWRGLLYLPRLFVYHVDAAAGSDKSETFKVMERRLLKAIMNPAMIVTWLAGLWLVWQGGWFKSGWFARASSSW